VLTQNWFDAAAAGAVVVVENVPT
jgi:hypothetical protein